jgi:hypothetical protein
LQGQQSSGPPLPEDPQFREIALAMETAGISGEILDGDWKIVFSILASKELIERLEPDDASATGIDPDGIDYVQLGELEGVSEKAVRDAGTIPVAEI